MFAYRINLSTPMWLDRQSVEGKGVRVEGA